MTTTPLSSLIPALARSRIAVLGDLMLDRYIWGRASRLSQEAPVPVVAVQKKTSAPGGAANVVRNLVSLGAQALTFGILGNDADGRELCSLLESAGALTDGIIIDDTRPTTVKTRVLAGTQQVVRIDNESTDPLDKKYAEQAVVQLEKSLRLGKIDAVILEDYAKGVLSRELVDEIISICKRHDVFVTLDPHPGNPFEAKGLKLMTPNRREAFALAGVYYQTAETSPLEDSALAEVGKILHEAWEVELLLITLGSRGMALYQGNNPPVHIPTEAREVFDVSGAGDTVMAVFTLALAAGASPVDAARMANSAAGVVVAEVGTAAVTKSELEQALQQRR